MTKFTGKGFTDLGKVRENNEDAFVVDNQSQVFIVSDGMGGVDGGEVASGIIVDELPKLIKHTLENPLSLTDITFQSSIQENIQSVNNVIYREGVSRGLAGMGATLVLVIIKDAKALIAHVGDSRCYHYVDKKLELLTKDHSDPVTINMLTRVMGTDGVVQADLQVLELKKESMLLLCSDGLNHMISDEAIENILTDSEDEKICYNLIEKANEAGGQDNITLILVREA